MTSTPSVTFTSLNGKQYSSDNYNIVQKTTSETGEVMTQVFDKAIGRILYSEINGVCADSIETYTYNEDGTHSVVRDTYTEGYEYSANYKSTNGEVDGLFRTTDYYDENGKKVSSIYDEGADGLYELMKNYSYNDNGSCEMWIDVNMNNKQDSDEESDYCNKDGKTMTKGEYMLDSIVGSITAFLNSFGICK
ncbi:MAG: hypothetical protein IKU37_08170 [Candidatus Gastranaerophilales bacterium]|nr:hypothetical protein [Candidatus Gastranaerophilales bacterium]